MDRYGKASATFYGPAAREEVERARSFDEGLAARLDRISDQLARTIIYGRAAPDLSGWHQDRVRLWNEQEAALLLQQRLDESWRRFVLSVEVQPKRPLITQDGTTIRTGRGPQWTPGASSWPQVKPEREG